MAFSSDQLSQDKFLDGKLLIQQPIAGYRAATDPVLLAAACPAKSGESVLDIGCGVGTAALCVGARVTGVKLFGLEVQADYAALAERNAHSNQLDMQVHVGDLSNMPIEVKDQIFDHVIMNPPFFGPGTKAADKGRALGRQEETELVVWLDAGLRRLRPGGWLTIIQIIDRFPEVIVSLNGRAGGLEIKPLSPRKSKSATRFVLRARKGSRSKTLLSHPLTLHDGDVHKEDMDSYSADARRILRHGEPLQF